MRVWKVRYFETPRFRWPSNSDANRVTVGGAVENPGVYDLPAVASDLVAALQAAGGVSADADPTVEIHDPIDQSSSNPQTSHRRQINLVSAASTGQGNVYLNDGSSVNVVRQAPRYVQVIGNRTTNKSIILPPNRNTRVLDALAVAGGLKYSIWISDRIDVIWRVPGRDGSVRITLSARRAKRDG